MRLNARECVDRLVEGYRVSLEDSGDFIASEMNSQVGGNIFEYDDENDEIVIAEGVKKLPHIRVEYDTEYFGGDYNKIGKFEFFPDGLQFVYDSVEEAFEAYTGIPKVHVIHYSSDERFFPDGMEWFYEGSYQP